MVKVIPVTDKETVGILELSVGVGNFIPLIIKNFHGKNIILDVVDIDSQSLELAQIILGKYDFSDICIINFINADFLSYN